MKAFESKNPKVFDYTGAHPEVFTAPIDDFKTFRGLLAAAEQFFPEDDWRTSDKSEQDAMFEKVHKWIVENTEGKMKKLLVVDGPHYHHIRRNLGWANQVMNSQSRKHVSFPKFRMADFNRPAIDLSKHKTHLLLGPSGLGKTKYAEAHFPRGYLRVNQPDDLKSFDAKYHHGIVFDEFNFRKMTGTNLIALLDGEDDYHLPCSYSDAHIPKGTAKMLCSNDPNILAPFEKIHPEVQNAINSRVKRIEITGPLFSGPAKATYSRRVGMEYADSSYDQADDNVIDVDDVVLQLFGGWSDDTESDEAGNAPMQILERALDIGTGPLCSEYRAALEALTPPLPTLDEQLRAYNGSQPMISLDLLLELSSDNDGEDHM